MYIEEELCVGRASEPSRAPWVVLPARLDGVMGQVHFVVAGHVLAEHEGELVGKLLRVGSVDAEDPDSEVLGADRPFRKALVAHRPNAFRSAYCSCCSSGRAACCNRRTPLTP